MATSVRLTKNAQKHLDEIQELLKKRNKGAGSPKSEIMEHSLYCFKELFKKRDE